MAKTILLLILSVLVGAIPVAAQSPLVFDAPTSPVYLVASYYNAIALGDYARAYDYWQTGMVPDDASRQEFAAGFADLQSVEAYARLPVRVDVAAGTARAEVPVVIQTTLTDGTAQIFAGCFLTVHFNAPMGDPPVVDPNWYLQSATMQAVTTPDFELATESCMFPLSFPTEFGMDDQFSPVALVSSYYDAIAAGDYARAYDYWWSGPPNQTLAEFAAGFAETDDIGVIVGLDFYSEGAAGSIYSQMPVLLTATDAGVLQVFVGCIWTRRSNVPVGDNPEPDPNWYLYRADFRVATDFDAGLAQLWTACQANG